MFHHGEIVAKRNSLKVIDCIQCGFPHLDPIPDPDIIFDYYSKEDAEYGTEEGLAWLDKEKNEHEAGLWESMFRWHADLLGNRGSLLDVGAGSGYFVEWWRLHVKAEVDGVEPSPSCRNYLGVDMYESIDDVAMRYDNIRMCLVLEHIHDAKIFLEKCCRLLNPGGHMLIQVPNEFSPVIRIARKFRGDWFVDKRHINYFSPVSLRQLLESIGLTVEFEGVGCPTELFWPLIWSSKKSNMKVYRFKLGVERMMKSLAFILYNMMYDKFGTGRELVMISRR